MQKRNNALIYSIALRINSNKEIVNQAIDALIIISGDKLLAAKGMRVTGLPGNALRNEEERKEKE
ncbi:hypothetical protein SM113_003236 [Cronobacter turicensis]|nr:hypothetical protein [Cronobacter turicensis]